MNKPIESFFTFASLRLGETLFSYTEVRSYGAERMRISVLFLS